MSTLRVIKKALAIDKNGGNTEILEELMEENIELVIQEDRFFELPFSMFIRILKNVSIDMDENLTKLILSKAKSSYKNIDEIFQVLNIKTIEDKVKYVYGNDRLAANILKTNKKLQAENELLHQEIDILKNEVATLKSARSSQDNHTARNRTPLTKSYSSASARSAHYPSRVPKAAMPSDFSVKANTNARNSAPKNANRITARSSKNMSSSAKTKK